MSHTETDTMTPPPKILNADQEVRSLHTMCMNHSDIEHPWHFNFWYALIGVIFGIAFVKTEIISWFRIQEMFRLQSFHMYGVIGTGVVVGMFSVWLIKRLRLKTRFGEIIEFYPKTFNKGQIIGGLIFGFGSKIYSPNKIAASSSASA